MICIITKYMCILNKYTCKYTSFGLFFQLYIESKSSFILKKHQDKVVQMLPIHSTEFLRALCAEGIITVETKSTVMGRGSEALVQAIVESVEENPDRLEALVKMFLQRDDTVSVAERILGQ